MNQTQIAGLLRDLGKILAIALASYGILDEATWLAIIGGLSMAGLSLWSFFTNSTAAMVSGAAQSPEVKQIVTTPAIAKADPSPKVVTQ